MKPSVPADANIGGHPYTPRERELGYGTDHDPRFTSKPNAATNRRFWLFVIGDGWVSWKPYRTEKAALRWLDYYLERGCRVEMKGWDDAAAA